MLRFMLNWIWAGLFLLSFIFAAIQFLVLGQPVDWEALSQTLFSSSKTAFEVCLGLAGPMCFWLGVMKIAEKAGLLARIAKVLSPLFKSFFPGVPSNHPAISAMTMNISANVLGLDNAATPFGLKAMKELQSLNPHPETATDAQVLFLVINTASVTLIPIGVMTQLSQLGMKNPSEIILPTLVATIGASVFGVFVTLLFQKETRGRGYFIPLFSLAIVSALLVALVAWTTSYFESEAIQKFSQNGGALIILFFLMGILGLAVWKRNPVFEHFVEGAKEGFQVVLNILPYLVAMLAAVTFFKASGAMDFILKPFDAFSFKDALPTAMMRPFSGSGSRALMIETIQRLGVDSVVSKMVALIQGSSETTLYVLSVYFGSVGLKKMRHALVCGLLSDLVAVILSITVATWFFG